MDHSAYDSKGRRKYLNAKESTRFRKKAENLTAGKAAFCLTLYFTGCRISECLNLQKTDIDLPGKVITFRTLKQRKKETYRRVPIPGSLALRLKILIAETKTDKLWTFSRTTGWRIVKDVMAEAKITGIHAVPKGLRHGFGVRAALAKIPVTVIQKIMGHADLSNTAIYLDVKDEEERKLISRTW
ncbi:MAG: tyrosine-type recombinase/integrase [Verrucomicrobiales bacterium]|nr:tyrosine-type recombinase/integrase [Verrucomicrobiales bacterium]